MAKSRSRRRCGFDSWVRKIPWRRKWQPNPVFLPGKSHGQWNLAGYTAHEVTDLDMTDFLFFFKYSRSVSGAKERLAQMCSVLGT